VPAIVGGAELVTGVASTEAVAAEVAVARPPAFVAVTWTRSPAPTSPAVAV
jgi:hypothetical protein